MRTTMSGLSSSSRPSFGTRTRRRATDSVQRDIEENDTDSHSSIEADYSPSKRRNKQQQRRSLSGIGLSTIVLCALVWILHTFPERLLHPNRHKKRRGVDMPKIKSPPAAVLVDASVGGVEVHQHQYHEQRDNHKLLALLYPPGLMGGYRNQVLRFVGFVVYAMQHEFSMLFLPSLMWTTQVQVSNDSENEEWVPIPMDLIFDVEYWNQVAKKAEKGDVKMPILVDYDPKHHHYDCWTTESNDKSAGAVLDQSLSKLTQQVISRGFLTPIYNESVAIATRSEIINPRKIDFLEKTQSCTSPAVYGGGTGAGRLWNDVMGYLRKSHMPFSADALVLRALRPKQEWRTVAMQCVKDQSKSSSYVALHARVELEMMDHNCGKTMEKNLTKIFTMMEDFMSSKSSSEHAEGLFVAVSRSGMEEKGRRYQKFQTYADENLQTINRIVGSTSNAGGTGLVLPDKTHVSVFECGQRTMDQYYREHPDSIDYGSLLQSMVNFYIATEASAFVGVHGSSYSTDIWTTRYHQGKGNTNYEYTPDGIFPVPNGGLPPAHKTCKNK